MRTLVLGAVVTACLAGSAIAAGPVQSGWLTLKAKTSTGHILVDGTVWTCKVDVCRAERVKPSLADQSCKKLSAELGEITGFGYRGESLTAEALATCNAD